MKIAVLDFATGREHSKFNSAVVKSFSRYGEVFAVTDGNNFVDINDSKNIKYQKVVSSPTRKDFSKLSSFRNAAINYQKIQWDAVKKYNVDAVFILNLQNVVHFSTAKYIYNSGLPIFVLIHDVGYLNKRKVLKIFNSERFVAKYIDKINFVVLEEFKKQALINIYNVKKREVFVLPWLPHTIDTTDYETDDNLFISLSNSNDEMLVEEIIAKEKESEMLKTNNIHYYLRSHKYTFDNGALHVYNGFLEDKKYCELYSKAAAVITPFPIDFGYRVSGTTLDAMLIKKFTIGTEIDALKYYKSEFPSMCMTFKTVDELFDILISKPKFNISEDDHNRFMKYYSVETLDKKIDKIVEYAKQMNKCSCNKET